jgi:hypothetical protein
LDCIAIGEFGDQPIIPGKDAGAGSETMQIGQFFCALAQIRNLSRDHAALTLVKVSALSPHPLSAGRSLPEDTECRLRATTPSPLDRTSDHFNS